MNQIALILLTAWAAGLASFAGAIMARFERFEETERKQQMVHGVVAFGGGILLAAVAYALAPEGMERLSPIQLALIFSAGGGVFCYIDFRLSQQGGSKAQMLAMLMDFVPEALSLGAVFAENRKLGTLLALFIGAQNLPEGFNSFRESRSAGVGSRHALLALLACSLLGPLAAGIGYLYLRGNETLTAAIMSFAAGGILYLIFQDIAPQAKMRHRWKPSLGAVFGFLVGMIGKQLLG